MSDTAIDRSHRKHNHDTRQLECNSRPVVSYRRDNNSHWNMYPARYCSQLPGCYYMLSHTSAGSNRDGLAAMDIWFRTMLRYAMCPTGRSRRSPSTQRHSSWAWDIYMMLPTFPIHFSSLVSDVSHSKQLISTRKLSPSSLTWTLSDQQMHDTVWKHHHSLDCKSSRRHLAVSTDKREVHNRSRRLRLLTKPHRTQLLSWQVGRWVCAYHRFCHYWKIHTIHQPRYGIAMRCQAERRHIDRMLARFRANGKHKESYRHSSRQWMTSFDLNWHSEAARGWSWWWKLKIEKKIERKWKIEFKCCR